MKQGRLFVLLAVMVALTALRWRTDSATPDAASVVAAASRPAARMAGNDDGTRRLIIASAADLAAGTRDAEDGPVRNAFAVRAPPPAPRPPPPPPAPKLFVGPPLPPPLAPPVPPPPPPLQVFGEWSDERGTSVFVAGPRGVMQGRVGDVVLSEYRITQIAPQQVQVVHLPSQRVIPLPVPSGSLPPPLTTAR